MMRRPRADVSAPYPSAALSIDELPKELRHLLWGVRDHGLHFGGSRAAPISKRDKGDLRELHRRSKLQVLSIEEAGRLGRLAEASEDSAIVVFWRVDERGGVMRIHRLFCRAHQDIFPRHGLAFSWGDGDHGMDLGVALLKTLYGHADRGVALDLLGPLIAALPPIWHLAAKAIEQRSARHKLIRAIERAVHQNIDVRAVVDGLVPAPAKETLDG